MLRCLSQRHINITLKTILRPTTFVWRPQEPYLRTNTRPPIAPSRLLPRTIVIRLGQLGSPAPSQRGREGVAHAAVEVADGFVVGFGGDGEALDVAVVGEGVEVGFCGCLHFECL